jgi:3-hydroxyacyl-CoA dehydrogenase
VEAAVAPPFDEGLAVERQEFQKLLKGPQSAALRHVFAAERAAQKIPGLSADQPVLPIRKVGVIGAGTMGSGIAMTFLNAGLSVTIVETTKEALDRGLASVAKIYGSRVQRGKMTAKAVDASTCTHLPMPIW